MQRNIFEDRSLCGIIEINAFVSHLAAHPLWQSAQARRIGPFFGRIDDVENAFSGGPGCLEHLI